MPTIQQLPSASSTSTTDEIPVSQSGTTRSVTIGALLATAQPVITLPSTTLLGRNSLGPGGPEVVAPGIGLQLTNGSLSADGADHADFPLETHVNVTDNVILDSDGTPARLPLNALRDLFTAGSNVTIQGGTISATASSELVLPTAAPLLSSNGTTLSAVVLGSNLSLNGGTLSAASAGVAAPAAAALISSTGTSLTGITLGANLSLAAGTLSAISLAAPAVSGLVSSTGSSLTTVALAGASYSGGTLTVPSYTLPAASAASLGGVKAGANLTIAADGTISAPAPLAVPATAPLLASAAGSLATVALGNNLTLSAGTLSATAPTVPTSAALLASTASGALSNVALNGLSYAGGTLTASGSSIATTAAAGVVKPDGSTISISPAGVISTTGTATISSSSPVNPVSANGTATASLSIATLLGQEVHVDNFGAVGNYVQGAASPTDDAPAFQAAINALGTRGGRINIGPKNYYINSPITITAGTVEFVGKGVAEGAYIGAGSWIVIGAATFNPFTVGTPYVAGSSYQPSGAALGTKFRNFGVYQLQTFPSTTVGAGWSAKVNYPFVFSIYNSDSVSFHDVFFLGVDNGIYWRGCGHMRNGDIAGQFYTCGIQVENCQDLPYFGNLRSYPYLNNTNPNIYAYQLANLKFLNFGRMDGCYIQSLFGFVTQYCIYCYQEPAVTGQTNPSANTAGGFATGTIDYLSLDHSSNGFYMANITTGGNESLIPSWKFGKVETNAFAVSGSGSDPYIDGATAIYVNTSWGMHISVGECILQEVPGSAISINGDGNVFLCGSMTIKTSDAAVTTPAPPAVLIADNGGVRNPNMGFIGLVFMSAPAAAAVIGSNGNGVYNDPVIWRGSGAFINQMRNLAISGSLAVSSTGTAPSATPLATLAAGAGTQLRMAPNLSAGGYATSVQAGDFVIVPDVGGAINTGGLVIGHSNLGYEWRYDNATGNHAIGGNRVTMPPLKLPNYALSSVPAASSYTGCYIDVTGYTATGVGPLARSDGTNWRFVANGAIVS